MPAPVVLRACRRSSPFTCFLPAVRSASTVPFRATSFRSRTHRLQPATVAGLTLALAAAAYASTQIVYAEEQASPLPSSKALVIGVIGCPGSGKTTQSRKLAKAFDLTLVEVADERELRRKLAELSSRARARVLIEGFPRNLEDADWFQSRIAHFAFLVFMDTPPHDVAKRTRQGGKKASEAHAQWHQGAEALVKRFRYQGNFLEIAGEMSEDEVWDMVEHKVDQCLQLDERGEL